MPFSAARLRLSSSFTSPLPRCDTPHVPSQSSLIRRQRQSLQTAVFVSCAAPSSSSRPSPSLRSPLQWSHVLHHIRKPAALSASTSMATDSSTTLVQSRTHMGHSHGHHHHHDTSLLTSKNRNDPGVRITRIGLYVNLGMAIAKGAGGYVFNSKA